MAYLLQHVCIEVEISVPAKVSSTEGSLKGVRVLDAQLSPNNYTGCCLLRFLYCEAAIYEAECVCLSLQYKRKYSFLVLVVFRDRITIHKYVFLA